MLCITIYLTDCGRPTNLITLPRNKTNCRYGKRNYFYGETYPSSITAVLNAEPSSIKNFHAIGYEGSQGKINPFSVYEMSDGSLNLSDLQPNNYLDEVTGSGNGWEIQSIQTDMDLGFIDDFVEKENKWFSYIRGSQTHDNNESLSSNFSFQGLGMIKNVDYNV